MGCSMQLAIQHFAKVFENLLNLILILRRLLDFWDKMRIMMHVRILMEFEGTGKVQYYGKGSRDPYLVTGRGAGFVLCWSKNVKIRLGYSNDQMKFFRSILDRCAIPNLATVVSDGSLSADNTGLIANLQYEGLNDSETSTIRTQSSNTR